MSKTKDNAIQQQRREPTHFALVPKMAQRDLTPFELALYCNLKQTASDNHDGLCWKSNRTLAQECQMSVSKVKACKQSLASKGFIALEQRAETGETTLITLVDVWEKNHNRYTKITEGGSHHKATPQPPQSQGVVATKPQRITHEEEPIEEEDSAPAKSAVAAQPEPNGRPRNAWYDAIKAVWGHDGGLNGDVEKWLKGTSNKPAYKPYNLTVQITPDDLKAWAAWWRKQNPDLPIMLRKPDKVQSSILGWIEAGKPDAQCDHHKIDGYRIIT